MSKLHDFIIDLASKPLEKPHLLVALSKLSQLDSESIEAAYLLWFALTHHELWRGNAAAEQSVASTAAKFGLTTIDLNDLVGSALCFPQAPVAALSLYLNRLRSLPVSDLPAQVDLGQRIAQSVLAKRLKTVVLVGGFDSTILKDIAKSCRVIHLVPTALEHVGSMIDGVAMLPCGPISSAADLALLLKSNSVEATTSAIVFDEIASGFLFPLSDMFDIQRNLAASCGLTLVLRPPVARPGSDLSNLLLKFGNPTANLSNFQWLACHSKNRVFPQAFLSVEPRLCASITALDFSIRTSLESDFSKAVELETKCWEPNLRLSPDELKSRLAKLRDTTFLVEIGNDVAGILYTQRIASTDSINGKSAITITDAQCNDGAVVQLITLNVDPAYQHLGLGDGLRKFALMSSLLTPSIASVVAVTRCRSDCSGVGMDYKDYVFGTDSRACALDGTIEFHRTGGASVVSLVPNYRPLDTVNRGNGVLIEYNIRNRRFVLPSFSTIAPKISRDIRSFGDILETVAKIVKEIVSQDKLASIDNDFSFHLLGFDSTDLMLFRSLLERTFEIQLDASVFFSHNTTNELSHYLKREYFSDTALSSGASPLEVVALNQSDKAIAIIGLSCRAPQCSNSTEMWNRLVKGEDLITTVPSDRSYLADNYAVNFGGFLADVDRFDAEFFNITPREATLMDPQVTSHRVFFVDGLCFSHNRS